jgi:hypothetical protein
MHGQGIADVFRSAAAASLSIVTVGLLLAFSACAPTAGYRQTNPYEQAYYQDAAQHPERAAAAADHAAAENAKRDGNYVEAERLEAKSKAEERAYTAQRANVWQAKGNDYAAAIAYEQAHDYPAAVSSWLNVERAGTNPEILAIARGHLGMAYEFGIGVPQDFDEALNWYHKAVNTTTVTGALVPTIPGAVQGVGLLYAYGLGVPRDRTLARQLLVKARADNLVTLLDNNALPRAIRGNNQFFQDVAAATNALQQRQADNLAAALRAGDQQRPRPSSSGTDLSLPGPSISYCNKLTTGSFVSGMLGNPWCD